MPVRTPLFCLIIFVAGFSCAYAQAPSEAEAKKSSEAEAKKPAESTETKTTKAPEETSKPPEETTKPPKKEEEILPVTIILAGGAPLLVDEVSESRDGYWYKRGNVTTFLDRARVVRIEHPKPPSESAESEVSQARTKWSLAEATKVKEFFLTTFNKPLPLSAFGQSDLHTRWGLDHRNGMDVNLHPDSVEGQALVAFLRAESIPFLVFRGPIPGVATGPHIHVGNRSPRSYGR